MATRSQLFIAAALAAVLAAPDAAFAEPADERIDAIDDRLRRLEEALVARDDELRAARETVEAQRRRLEAAGLAEPADETEAGALARYRDATELRGWVAASYWWNANRPDPGAGGNRGNPALGFPPGGMGPRYHPDHNTFQLDQAWLGVRKRADEDMRAGFGVEVLFGKTADALRGATPTRADLSSIYQAYVEWLAPLGPGVLVTLGRFETHIGVETLRTPDNPNVTRGLLKTHLHPVTHTGAKLETTLGPLRAMLGVANDVISDPDTDADDDKALLWAFGLPLGDVLDVQVGGAWGGDGLLRGSATTVPPGTSFGRNTDELGIVDVVVRWTPSDRFESYVVADYLWSDGEEGNPPGSAGPALRVPGDPDAWGVAAGSLYAITEHTAFGFRGEFMQGRDNFFDPFLTTGRGDHTLWSVTGTFAHELAPPLEVRLEGRYEGGRAPGRNSQLYAGSRPGRTESGQFVAGAEAVYEF